MIDRLSKGALRLRLEIQRRLASLSALWKPRLPVKDNLDFLSSGGSSATGQFMQYEMRLPDHQNAIDLLPGWSSAFPSELGLTAGRIPLFSDARILAALDTYGPIKGQTILEVGPLEGMHTYILNQREPARVDAVEANKLCFLRCLVTKEILKLNRVNFHLGDIRSWLAEKDTVYDLSIASGVLYHMHDPAEFLSLISARSNAIFIWTHFYDEAAMPPSDLRNLPFSGKVEIRDFDGLKLHYHERSYQHANTDASFCGGMRDRHYWMRKDEILLLLAHFGYTDIVELDVNLDHAGGPCASIFARKQPESVPAEP
ncbi:class I SAM-dependent methyltransferase [Hoeflea ulvae]|uniref:Class I SAM-dependent methyltransferase n=1 Tax=Hoeflea ulvae TaxID=2983764 RepID=A0ABT3YKF7_9HYPH|nr:class I SAM-dependent methyltransferase [Hoeflea ulvae]MCY0096384.1 class I SAM-dependent methyltransferase [Hoeflea ulvae]